MISVQSSSPTICKHARMFNYNESLELGFDNPSRSVSVEFALQRAVVFPAQMEAPCCTSGSNPDPALTTMPATVPAPQSTSEDPPHQTA